VLGLRGPGYAFHTAQEAQPWWMLDLKSIRRFDEVVIFNRIDAFRDRATGIRVEISDDVSNWTPIWTNKYSFGGVDGRPLRIVCENRTVRYLRILGSPNDHLHLNKVEIYDCQAKAC
jgi:F5/8 type C domain